MNLPAEGRAANTAESAIAVQNVYKSFERRVVGGGYTTLKTQLVQLFNRQKYREHLRRVRLDVLKGVSFSIMPGETVGIIGQNGAGKSTLLKLLTGIYRPTSGSVTHRGRISALLELGAGFHPEFSGRENIYMNGMILGLSRKELREREQQIIDFAELDDFIDAPVRTYSSGMYMRLAFAVAVNVDPEILIIDEILGVGDEHFQHKSKAKLDEFKRKKIAIVLVTHALDAVEGWCTRAIWLDGGRVAADGPPRQVVSLYRQEVQRFEQTLRKEEAPPVADLPPPRGERWSGGRVSIGRVRIFDKAGGECYTISTGEMFSIEIDYRLVGGVEKYALRLDLITSDGVLVSRVESGELSGDDTATRARCVFEECQVVGRDMHVDVAVVVENGEHLACWREAVSLDIISDVPKSGVLIPRSRWEF